jgi:cell division protein FtsL
MAPRDQSTRLIRERDHRSRRVMGAALLLMAFLVGGVLGVVGVKVQQVRASYRLEDLRALRKDVEKLNRQLKVELATLTALARVETRARAELGLSPPSAGQVRLAREYVSGVGGDTSSRTAWEDRLVSDGRRLP